MKNKKEIAAYSGLLLFGLISALVLIKPHFLTIGNGWIPKFRCERLENALDVYTSTKQFDFSRISHTVGYVLYFPILMQKFNVGSGYDMFCVVQSISAGIVICVYPILMYRLFYSKTLALISPIIIQFTFGDLLYIDKASEYWSGCWALALGLPLLMLFMKENKDRNRFVITLCIALIMSLANVLRGQSGLPLLLTFFTALGVLLFKKRITLKRVCIYILICVCAYNMFGTTIPNAVAHRWGYDGVIAYNSSPWHSILIGMGYVDNDYGLYYSDDSAKAIIEKIDPSIVYNSNEYYDACKRETFKIIKSDPGFVFKGLVAKMGKCIQLQVDYIWGSSSLTYYWHPYVFLMIIVLINTILLIRQKRNVCSGGGIILCLEAVLLSLYSGILAYPSEYYIWGSLGGTGVFLVMLCYSMISANVKIE